MGWISSSTHFLQCIAEGCSLKDTKWKVAVNCERWTNIDVFLAYTPSIAVIIHWFFFLLFLLALNYVFLPFIMPVFSCLIHIGSWEKCNLFYSLYCLLNFLFRRSVEGVLYCGFFFTFYFWGRFLCLVIFFHRSTDVCSKGSYKLVLLVKKTSFFFLIFCNRKDLNFLFRTLCPTVMLLPLHLSLATTISLSYVGFLYAFDYNGTDRNHPKSIKRRFCGAVVCNLISILTTYILLAQVSSFSLTLLSRQDNFQLLMLFFLAHRIKPSKP